MKRVEMPRRMAPMVRTRLTRRRALRRTLTVDEDYAIKRRILLRRPCAVCFHPSEVVHHRKLRSQGGDNSWSNLIQLCEWHHVAAHRYPAIAHSVGLIVLRNEDPALIPIISIGNLETAPRLRFTRPAYDWQRAQMAITEENGRLGPERAQ